MPDGHLTKDNAIGHLRTNMTDNAPQTNKLFSNKWLIPGMGEAKPYCGNDDWITLECSSRQAGHDHQKLIHSCKRLNCPICWDDGAWREAFKAYERMDGISEQWAQNGRDLRHPVHIITSPGKDDMYRPMEDLRKEQREIIQELGGVGGLSVFHPYRGSEKTMDRIRSRVITPKPSPHFHNLIFMPSRPDDRLFDADQITRISEKTGWVIKIMPREIRSGKRAGEYFNVVNKIHYELTHCGINSEKVNNHTLTWWGICAYNNIKVEIEKLEEPHLCTKCGAEIHEYRTNEYIIKPGYTKYLVDLDEMITVEPITEKVQQDCGPHMIRRTIRHYNLTIEQIEKAIRRWGLMMGPYTLPAQKTNSVYAT